ncbi:MAG: hypothetical protein AAB276_05930 [Pseudomonadota bacterium]
MKHILPKDGALLTLDTCNWHILFLFFVLGLGVSGWLAYLVIASFDQPFWNYVSLWFQRLISVIET